MRLAMNTTNPANLGAVSFTKTPLERSGVLRRFAYGQLLVTR